MARGHLRRRGNSWQVIVSTRDPLTGKRKQESRTRRTKRDAERTLNLLLAQTGHSSTDATFGDLAEAWYGMASVDWSPKTALEVRRWLDKPLLPTLGDIPLRRLEASTLDRFYGQLRATGSRTGGPLSSSTVRRMHNVVRRALAQGVRWGWITDNPADRATPPPKRTRDIHPPDVETVRQLIELADPAFRVFLRLAAVTGARRGELCALRWSDIDFRRRSMTIKRGIVIGPEGIVEKDTKTAGSRRRISLDGDTLAALREHRTAMHHRCTLVGVRLEADAFVFSEDERCRTPWRPEGLVERRFRKLRAQVGAPTVRLHDLRHFAATQLLAAGVPLRTVAGRLGHGDGGTTTLRVYGHFLEEADRAAADEMGGLIG